MNVNIYGDPFYQWVLQNEWISRFISYDKPKNSGKMEEKQLKLIHTIEEITDFYECRLLVAVPDKPHFKPFPRSMLSSSVYLAHIHFFLQNKLYKYRCKGFELAKQRVAELLQALHASLVSNVNIVINIDIQELIRYLLSDSEKCIRLTNKDSVIVNQISKEDLLLFDDQSSNQTAIMNQILTGMNPSFDRKNLLIGENPLQEKFEQLFFHSNFHFRKEIDSLFEEPAIKSPQIFTELSIHLMQKMLDFYKFTDSANISIFSFIYFRALFSYGISIKHDFFFPDIKCEFCNYVDFVEIEQTGALMKYIPHHEPNDSIKEIVMKNQKLVNAATELTTTAFYSTPFDILSVIHKVLAEIRNFVCDECPSSDDALSFDTIFGLFIIILVASDLPNQEQVFRFVLDFTPFEGLSGSLEYARATISAAAIQCETILNNVKAKHSNSCCSH